MAGLPTGGDGGSSIKYTAKDTWTIKTGNTDRATINNSGLTVTDDVAITGDVNAGGGFRSVYEFHTRAVHQSETGPMSGSLYSGSLYSTRRSAPAAGSVLGISLYSPDSAISAGALTASVTIDGVQQATPILIMTTGSAAAATAISKDTRTFSASQQIGVVFTASDNYVSDLATSGSFVASVLLEM